MGRFTQLAVVASLLALEDAGLDDVGGERSAVTIHTGAGGLLEGDEEVLARREDAGTHRAAVRAAGVSATWPRPTPPSTSASPGP